MEGCFAANGVETSAEVVNKLKTTASLYPNKNSNFGWGKLDADAATN